MQGIAVHDDPGRGERLRRSDRSRRQHRYFRQGPRARGSGESEEDFGVRRLGTLGGAYSLANDINNHTQVAGVAGIPRELDRPFLWTPGSGLRNLGTLGGDQAAALGVNDHGDVAGVSLLPNNFSDRAFLWIRGHGLRNLGTFGGRHSIANEVNERREVAGSADLPNGKDRAFLWRAGHGLRNLGNLGPASNDVWAGDVNNASQVVGTLWLRGFDENDPDFLPPHRGFAWTPERGMRRLPSLGGQNTRAFANNEDGDIVGFADLASGRTVAVFWRTTGRTVNLGSVGGDFAIAFGINQGDVVVGFSVDGSGRGRPFVWTKEAGMHPLPIGSAAGAEGEATGINEKNEISGTLFRPDAPPVAVLWRPRSDASIASRQSEGDYTMEVRGMYAGNTARVPRAGCAKGGLRPSEAQRGRVSATTCAR